MDLRDVLCTLVRLALSPSQVQGDKASPLPGPGTEAWTDVLKMARRQTVSGLVFSAVRRLPASVGVPGDVVLELMKDATLIARRSVRVQQLSEHLVATLEEAGFHPVVMKGPSVATFYPEPDLRTSGDLDLFLPEDAFESVSEWMRDKGFPLSEDPAGSRQTCIDGIDVDLHRRYFDLHVPDSRLPSVPSPEATLMMLSTHILKHAMGPGVGLRQLCDLGMAFRALDGKFNREVLLEYYRRNGLLRWNQLLSSFLRERLGIDDGLFPGDRMDISPLESIVFSGGNFGHFAAGRQEQVRQSPFRRKMGTAARYLKHSCFAFRYAPCLYLRSIVSLTVHNILPATPRNRPQK